MKDVKKSVIWKFVLKHTSQLLIDKTLFERQKMNIVLVFTKRQKIIQNSGRL